MERNQRPRRLGACLNERLRERAEQPAGFALLALARGAGGSGAAYVTGLHQALLIGAGLAAAGALATVTLLVPRWPSHDKQPAAAADPLAEVG